MQILTNKSLIIVKILSTKQILVKTTNSAALCLFIWFASCKLKAIFRKTNVCKSFTLAFKDSTWSTWRPSFETVKRNFYCISSLFVFRNQMRDQDGISCTIGPLYVKCNKKYYFISFIKGLHVFHKLLGNTFRKQEIE